MATQVATDYNRHLARARASGNGVECMKLYDDWAATYNSDLINSEQDYVAPMLTAKAALESGAPAQGTILDAGCGTGLVGEALAAGGAMTIDGLDLSPPMLRVAEQTGVYRDLFVGDLTKPIDKPNAMYDLITCAGTFTSGHVGPDPALREFIRITKDHGIIVATVLEEVWEPMGFRKEFEKLQAENLVKVLSLELKDYVKGRGDKARLIVLEKVPVGSTML